MNPETAALDVHALQATLRQFATEWEWRPFHTPKNLSMALMVKAAELAGIFQWMTPEQSSAVSANSVLQRQIAAEVADVMLYALQLADRAGIDVERAIASKLLENATKRPPVSPGAPSGAATSVKASTHVLVDWENVQPKDTDIRAHVPDVTHVWLFHGPGQTKAGSGQASFGDRITLIPIARTGKNALDFHLSFYMGYIASRQPKARSVVMSNDKGYSPMLEHATMLGFAARQIGFGDASNIGAKTLGSKVAATKKVPSKKAAAKQAPHARAKVAQASSKTSVVKKAAAKNAAAAKKSVNSSPVVVAKKSGTAKSTATTATATPAMASEVARPDAVRAGASRDLGQAVQHVHNSLRKTSSRPARQSKLLAMVKSLLGPSTEDETVNVVLARLLAKGVVTVDDKGAVSYSL